MIPKFRVWVEEDKKMFGVDELEFEDDADGNCGNLYRVIYPKYDWKLESAEFPRDCILMQSTGLKDKNGKEIYEGDIYLEYYIGIKKNPDKRVVSYGNQQGIMGFNCPSVTNGDNHYVEVIGNIYENPELLEDKQCSK